MIGLRRHDHHRVGVLWQRGDAVMALSGRRRFIAKPDDPFAASGEPPLTACVQVQLHACTIAKGDTAARYLVSAASQLSG